VSECQADDVDESFPEAKVGRLSLLQGWMFARGWRHLSNALSTARWLVWRARGGRYGE
jgi:hypothetical protein